VVTRSLGTYRIIAELGHGKPLSAAHQYVIVADALAGLQHAHELCDYDGAPCYDRSPGLAPKAHDRYRRPVERRALMITSTTELSS